MQSQQPLSHHFPRNFQVFRKFHPSLRFVSFHCPWYIRCTTYYITTWVKYKNICNIVVRCYPFVKNVELLRHLLDKCRASTRLQQHTILVMTGKFSN